MLPCGYFIGRGLRGKNLPDVGTEGVELSERLDSSALVDYACAYLRRLELTKDQKEDVICVKEKITEHVVFGIRIIARG
jgi:hypothetical protein